MHGYSNGGTKHRAPPPTITTTGTAATLCLADSQWTVIEIHAHHRRHRPSSIRIRQYHKAEAFQSANMADSDAGDFLYCAGIGKRVNQEFSRCRTRGFPTCRAAAAECLFRMIIADCLKEPAARFEALCVDGKRRLSGAALLDIAPRKTSHRTANNGQATGSMVRCRTFLSQPRAEINLPLRPFFDTRMLAIPWPGGRG